MFALHLGAPNRLSTPCSSRTRRRNRRRPVTRHPLRRSAGGVPLHPRLLQLPSCPFGSGGRSRPPSASSLIAPRPPRRRRAPPQPQPGAGSAASVTASPQASAPPASAGGGSTDVGLELAAPLPTIKTSAPAPSRTPACTACAMRN